MTKYFMSASDASIILVVLESVARAAEKSAVMFAALGIDAHDLAKCQSVLNRLEKAKKVRS